MKKLFLLLSLCCLLLTGCDLLPQNDTFSSAEPEFSQEKTDDLLTIRVLDVGQGDSILLTTPNGKHLMIDTGDYVASSVLTSDLRIFAGGKLDYLILTHPHADHIANASTLLSSYEVKNVWMLDAVADNKAYSNLMDVLERMPDIPVTHMTAGVSATIDQISLTVLSPFSTSYDSLNNQSAVIMVTYENFRMLLTGDIEAETEAALLAQYDDLHADVLKIAHHGSDSSSTLNFLLAASPKYAVISVGADNDYGLPDKNILTRLSELDISTFRTDKNGIITIRSDGNAFSVSAQRESPA